MNNGFITVPQINALRAAIGYHNDVAKRSQVQSEIMLSLRIKKAIEASPEDGEVQIGLTSPLIDFLNKVLPYEARNEK